MSFHDFSQTLGPYLADDKVDSDYCPGRVAYEWTKTGGSKLVTCESGIYERDIETFLSRDLGRFDTPEENLIVIIGGIGTGKSTCILRCLGTTAARPRKCSLLKETGGRCAQQPRVVHLDFKGFEDEQVLLSNEKKREKFWNVVATRLKQNIRTQPSRTDEVRIFWPWCLRQARLLECAPELNIFFQSVEPSLNELLDRSSDPTWSPQQREDSLLRARDDLFKNMSSEGLAWYNVFLFVFEQSRGQSPCTCAYLFVDNVDGLDPKLQNDIVSLAQLLCSVMRLRTTIAIRPLTWKNTHVEYLLSGTNHFAPNFGDVLTRRIEECIKKEKPPEPIRAALHQLTIALTGESGRLASMIRATCGISIRYALRNVFNMMNSPLVAAAYTKSTFVNDMKVSEMARAYFFGDRNSMVPHAFENLYVTGPGREPTLYLVKPRILDYVHRVARGAIPINEVFTFMERFGHDQAIIKSALDDLMLRSRPLLWSEEGFAINDPLSKARLMTTPIGVEYIEELFGEVYYDEVCLAQNARDAVEISEVTAFGREISHIDLAEIQSYVRRCGYLSYRRAYGSAVPCVSLLHWKKMARALRRIGETYAGAVNFDEKGDIWLQSEVARLLA